MGWHWLAWRPGPAAHPRHCDTRVTNGTGRLFSSVKVKSPDKMQALPHNAELTLRVRHSSDKSNQRQHMAMVDNTIITVGGKGVPVYCGKESYC
jgi:hypothetical protein